MRETVTACDATLAESLAYSRNSASNEGAASTGSEPGGTSVKTNSHGRLVHAHLSVHPGLRYYDKLTTLPVVDV